MVERYLQQSLPVFLNRPLEVLFGKAHHVLSLHKKSHVTKWPDKICIIQPTQQLLSPTVNPDILKTVHEALLSECQLRVTYLAGQNADAIPKNYQLHPLGILQRGSIAYLAAMANDYENVYLYSLHRFSSVEILNEKLRFKPNFNLTDFAHTQGHFGTGELINFKARVCGHLAGILAETRLSADQTIASADAQGFHEVNAQILDTWQLQWWILGECDRMEILAPDTLREAIKGRVAQCHQLYQE